MCKVNKNPLVGKKREKMLHLKKGMEGKQEQHSHITSTMCNLAGREESQGRGGQSTSHQESLLKNTAAESTPSRGKSSK